MVNQAGEFTFISSDDFESLINFNLSINSEIFLNLKSKHFITDTDLDIPIELIATKLRTRKGFLRDHTVLHMVVITKRCNFCCTYCHATSESYREKGGDMSIEIARKVTEMIFQSPSPTIKIEFQGGEPLLNFKAIKEIVNYARYLNKKAGKKLDFVICTNLTLIDQKMLDFIKNNKILISTSLDGPKEIHDQNRINRDGLSGYDLFIEKLKLVRKTVGQDSCSALLTITKSNLQKLKEIIDEYIKQGFEGIFLRAINPYGFAKMEMESLGYPVSEFINKYKEALDYIIELNLRGKRFVEYYTTLLLTRIFTPFATGFMDLQSPSGAGISGVIYDYNGEVYPSDEARMLARTGDKRFYMGNVKTNSYEEIFNGSIIRELVRYSCVETLPGCASCAYQLYCGADPIRYYNETKRLIGHRPTSEFCQKNKGMIAHLFSIIRDNNEDIMDVFWSWITNRSLEEIRG